MHIRVAVQVYERMDEQLCAVISVRSRAQLYELDDVHSCPFQSMYEVFDTCCVIEAGNVQLDFTPRRSGKNHTS